jgi:transcriptional regulator with XRE-family HTH domain
MSSMVPTQALDCDRLIDARIAKDWNQSQLAERIGVKPGLISDWERGKHDPRCKYLKALAQALDVSADSLLGLR